MVDISKFTDKRNFLMIDEIRTLKNDYLKKYFYKLKDKNKRKNIKINFWYILHQQQYLAFL